jgi:hypothetical protein
MLALEEKIFERLTAGAARRRNRFVLDSVATSFTLGEGWFLPRI